MPVYDVPEPRNSHLPGTSGVAGRVASRRLRWWCFTVFLTSLSVVHAQNASVELKDVELKDKALYGKDDRIEVLAAQSALQAAATSVVAMVPVSSLSPAANDRWRLAADTTGTERGWCESERFREQPSIAHCTGFLIAPDRVATAAHCLNADEDPGGPGLNCADVRFLFDYHVDGQGIAPETLSEDQVFSCHRVTAGQESPNGPDWRVVQLDRPAFRQRLPVHVGDVPAVGTPLSIIGHPNGLPMKLASNATVRQVLSVTDFRADLDAYQGNSGSPVVADLGCGPVVVGLLSRGGQDFSEDDNAALACEASVRCRGEACEGEHVTGAQVVANYADRTTSHVQGTSGDQCAIGW